MKLFMRFLSLVCDIVLFGNMIASADDRIYRVKVVRRITNDPASHPSAVYALDSHPPVNTNSFRKEERMEMCETAKNRIRQEKGVRVWLWKDGKIELQKYYGILEDDGTMEIVMAFKCPSRPTIYVQVLEEAGTSEIVIAIVQMPREQIQRKMNSPIDDIEYKLLRASSVYKASRTEVSLYYDSNEDADSDQLTEGEFLRMCAKALEVFPDEEIEWTSSDDGNDVEFYRVRKMSAREVEFLLAYPCPTKPCTFVTVPRASRGGYISRFIVQGREKEKYVVRKWTRAVYYIDYKYELKVARTIEEVTSSSSRETRMHDDVVESAISSKELPEGDCLRLCREGLGVIRKEYQYGYHFKAIKEPELEKYYTLHLENDEDSDSVDVIHVEAFKCPTRPDVYIHVREMKGEESLVWVIIQDRAAKYIVQPVVTIREKFEGYYRVINSFHTVPYHCTHRGRHHASSPLWCEEESNYPQLAVTRRIVHKMPEPTGIDTDELSEKNRRTMCRKAVKRLGGSVNYLDGEETGLSALYDIEIAKEYATFVRVNNSTVRAFACPSEPKIYLEVELIADSLKYSIRVLIKEPYYLVAPRRDTINVPRGDTSASRRDTSGGDSLISQMGAYQKTLDFEK